MKILVTGGAGFIGSHVVDTYVAHGHEVVVVDDLSSGRASNLNPAATFYQLDIRSPELERVFQREQPQVINHHAAQMDVRRSVAEPIFDADVNISGSLNLLECARRYGVKRFVYISSGGAVYGEPQYLPCDEAHPINPICQYGASKHTVELYLYMYRENYGLDYVVLRYPNVYGPRQDRHGEAGVVAIFTGQMLAGEPVVVNGDGEQERDFVYVADCAAANLLALDKGRGPYNLGSGQGTTVNHIYAALQQITAYPRTAEHGAAKLGETRRIYLEANRARRELGWSPQTELHEGLKLTVRYLQDEDIVRPVKLKRAILRSQVQSNGHGRTAIKVEPLEALARVNRGLEARLDDLLRIAAEAVGGRSGSAYLLDDEGQVEEASVIFEGDLWARDRAAQSIEEPQRSGLAAWVEAHRRAALVSSTVEDPRWLKRDWDNGGGPARSAICVPLVAGRQLRGALTISKRGEGAFSKSDLALLLTIAGMYSLNGKRRAEPVRIGDLAPSQRVQA